VLRRDFQHFAAVTELDSNMMHAVMQTSDPALLYWTPATIRIMQSVVAWRREGLPVCYTIDAGPNVHVITEAASIQSVTARLEQLEGIQDILLAAAGGAARLL
jgi:diphosphomevalonate decarboxylase